MLVAALATAALATLSPLSEHPRSLVGAALLLVAPILYGFDSRSASIAFLAGAGCWLVIARFEPGSALGYWIFWLIALPRLRVQLSADKRDWRQKLLAWSVLLSLVAGCLYSLEIRVRDVAAVLFPAVCAALFLYGSGRDAGKLAAGSAGAALARPARLLGWLGIGVSLLLYTGDQAWGFAGVIDPPGIGLVDFGGTLALTLGASVLSLHGAIRELRSGRRHLVLAGLYPLVVLPGLAIVHATHSRRLGALYMSGYAVLLGASALAAGLRQGLGGAMASGYLLVSVIVLNRLRHTYSASSVLVVAAVLLLLLLAGLYGVRRARAVDGAHL